MWLDTVLWLIVLVAFVALEGATTALVSIWFAVGAAAAMLVSFFTNSPGIQLLVFAVVSAVTLAVMVPKLSARRRRQPPPVTNGSPLTIGKRGVVLREINPGEVGRVRVDGLDWQARAAEPLPEGAKCCVTDVDGAVLIVSGVTAEQTV